MEALSAGEADIVLATASLVRALSAVADLVQPPRELQGQLVPGLAILSQTTARRRLAKAVADALLDREGQALLARHGFGPPPIL
jgi:ABC-type Fe3+ transport system substrate-binding protein